MTTQKEKESVVDKKFQINFRDLIWIITILFTLGYFYTDNESDNRKSTELLEYRLDQLKMDQDKLSNKMDNLIDLYAEEKKRNNTDDN